MINYATNLTSIATACRTNNVIVNATLDLQSSFDGLTKITISQCQTKN